VIEVNGGAEFKGLIRTTDIDIADAIAGYAIARAGMGNGQAELAATAANRR
jgi:[lysine-biosynthesis-protein LysW]--L-2-aminoadipate ligase